MSDIKSYCFTAGSKVPSWIVRVENSGKSEEQLLTKAHGKAVFNSSCVVLRHKSGAVCLMKAAGCSDSSNCGIAIKNMYGCTIKTAPYLFSDGDKVADAFYNYLLKNRG
ncbi:MAG: hypothetical protein ACRCYD_16000 [Plesiomonas sp.]